MQFKVGEFSYSTGKLNGFQQFHVARRMLPVMAAGGTVAMADVLAQMPDDQVNYVLNICLAATQRETDAGTWAPVMTNGQLMFQDIDAATMLQLAGAVLKDNVSGFFAAVRALAVQATTATTTE